MAIIPNGRDFGAYQSCTSKSNGAYQIDGYFSHFISATTAIVYDIEDTATITCDTEDAVNIAYDIEDATTIVVAVDQSTSIKHDPEDSVGVEPQ